MREVTQANALVAQLTGEAGDGMLRLRNGVQAVSDYFGKDFAEVLRAVNNLSKGFGISAGEALALVRSGLVSGADAGRGEFLNMWSGSSPADSEEWQGRLSLPLTRFRLRFGLCNVIKEGCKEESETLERK